MREPAIRRRHPVLIGAGAAALLAGLAAAVRTGVVPDLTTIRRLLRTWGRVPTTSTTPGGATVQMHVRPPRPDLRVRSSPVWVWLPPGYHRDGRRYPLVLLLHGSPGTAADWFGPGRVDLALGRLVATGALPPVVVVAPDVNGRGIRDGGALDAVDGPRVDTWLNEDLLGWVDRTFRTRRERAGRAIGGFSAGAYAALDQGLHHQERWGGVVAIEPYGDPGSGGRRALGHDRAAIERHSPSEAVVATPWDTATVTVLASGGRGQAPVARRLATGLMARGQRVVQHEVAGARHTWRLARTLLPAALVDVARELRW